MRSSIGSARSSVASRGSRMSIESVTLPGMALTMFGLTVRLPTVVTRSPPMSRAMRRPLVVERADGLQGAQDAELPVVPAAGRDRVGVRAHHDRGPTRRARSLAEDVAHLVDGDAQRGLAHPANEQVATALVLVAQRRA